MKSFPFSKLTSTFCVMIRVYGQNTCEISVLRSCGCSVREETAKVSAMQEDVASQEETERAQAHSEIGSSGRTSFRIRSYADRIQGEAADRNASIPIQKDAPVVSQAISATEDSRRPVDLDRRRPVVQLPRSALGLVPARAQTDRRCPCLLHGSGSVAGKGTARSLGYGRGIYSCRYQGSHNRLCFRWFSEFSAHRRFAGMDIPAVPLSFDRPASGQSGEVEAQESERPNDAGAHLPRCARHTHGNATGAIACADQSAAQCDRSSSVSASSQEHRTGVPSQPRLLPLLRAIPRHRPAYDNQYRGVHEQSPASNDAYAANAGIFAFVGDCNDSHDQEIEMQWA